MRVRILSTVMPFTPLPRMPVRLRVLPPALSHALYYLQRPISAAPYPSILHQIYQSRLSLTQMSVV